MPKQSLQQAQSLPLPPNLLNAEPLHLQRLLLRHQNRLELPRAPLQHERQPIGRAAPPDRRAPKGATAANPTTTAKLAIIIIITIITIINDLLHRAEQRQLHPPTAALIKASKEVRRQAKEATQPQKIGRPIPGYRREDPILVCGPTPAAK